MNGHEKIQFILLENIIYLYYQYTILYYTIYKV